MVLHIQMYNQIVCKKLTLSYINPYNALLLWSLWFKRTALPHSIQAPVTICSFCLTFNRPEVHTGTACGGQAGRRGARQLPSPPARNMWLHRSDNSSLSFWVCGSAVNITHSFTNLTLSLTVMHLVCSRKLMLFAALCVCEHVCALFKHTTLCTSVDEDTCRTHIWNLKKISF